MHRTPTDVLESVEAEPGAVLEAHGVEDAQEVVAAAETRDGGQPSPSPAGDDVAALFDGELDDPERRRSCRRSPASESDPSGGSTRGIEHSVEEVDDAFRELESAAATHGGRPDPPDGASTDGQDPAETATDPDVARALEAAEEVCEGHRAESVSFE